MIIRQLRNFNPRESNIYGKLAFPEFEKMNGFVLLLLDDITTKVKIYTKKELNKKSACLVHCSYEQRDYFSYHNLGNAIDFHFTHISQRDAYNIILNTLHDWQVINHTGLGVYPQWTNPGFHLDVRDFKNTPARWAHVDAKYTDIKEGIKLMQ